MRRLLKTKAMSLRGRPCYAVSGGMRGFLRDDLPDGRGKTGAGPLPAAGAVLLAGSARQVGDELLENPDQAAPVRAVGGGDPEFQAGHRRAIGVVVHLADVLLRDDQPVEFGSDGRAGAGARGDRTTLRRREREFPAVGRDLLL